MGRTSWMTMLPSLVDFGLGENAGWEKRKESKMVVELDNINWTTRKVASGPTTIT
jgi:hypothetical protein